jgi:hypothetical protein
VHCIRIVLLFGAVCMQSESVFCQVLFLKTNNFASTFRLFTQVKMDRFSYAIPIVCVLPVTIIICLSMCEAKRAEPCYFANMLPDTVKAFCKNGLSLDSSCFCCIGVLQLQLRLIFSRPAASTARLGIHPMVRVIFVLGRAHFHAKTKTAQSYWCVSCVLLFLFLFSLQKK